MRYKADDIDLLLPSFAVKVRAVLQAMMVRGFMPIPFDTLRTPKEAAKYAARGVGSVNSMHIYGAACDVICAKHGWSCREKGCVFFSALGNEAEKAGLVWGGRFPSRHDEPHIQACSVADQAEVRRLAWDDRDAFVKARLCA